MRVGYTKIGRAQAYNPRNWGPLGADNEAPMLLNRLARRNPDVQFVLLGHNDASRPEEVGLPANVHNPLVDLREEIRKIEKRWLNVKGTPPVENSLGYIRDMRAVWAPWFGAMDHLVYWMGQNDTINQPIPKIDGTEGLGASRAIYIRHCSYLLDGLNLWRDVNPHEREPIWLCTDVWNQLKARDLRWPHREEVICQYDFEKPYKHWRYEDSRSPEELGWDDVAWWDEKTAGCWKSNQQYGYHALELGCSVPQVECSMVWEGRGRFGVIINQSRAISGRDEVLRDWVLPLNPDWVKGSWDEERLQKLGAGTVTPYPWSGVPALLQTVRCGLAVPIRRDYSWATPKAWEMFAAGTVCFFHPRYDTQGHILPTLSQRQDLSSQNVLRKLSEWLRVETPEQLRKRVDHLNQDRDAWAWLVSAQRQYYEIVRDQETCLNEIDRRLGLTKTSRSVA